MTTVKTQIAIVIPCFNEESTIGQTVSGFAEHLPSAKIFVILNGCTDETEAEALRAGAIVISEPRPGKGFAVRRAFSDIDAEIYLMVDGDSTYDPSIAKSIVEHVNCGYDMVSVARRPMGNGEEYRVGHKTGNRVLTGISQQLLGSTLSDALSGYRGFSRRFVKSFVADARGFEIEVYLNLHAVLTGARVTEISGSYFERPEDSHSKLRTYSDGFRILRSQLRLARDWRPGLGFSIISIPWFVTAALFSVVPISEYLEFEKVYSLASFFFSVFSLTLGLGLVASGIIVSRIAASRLDSIRLWFQQ